jgi:hypothetical protein
VYLDGAYFFFFLGLSACANTDPAMLLIALGDFIFRSSPEMLLAVLELERALVIFVFMLGSFFAMTVLH